jgi:hypothetical protein
LERNLATRRVIHPATVGAGTGLSATAAITKTIKGKKSITAKRAEAAITDR